MSRSILRFLLLLFVGLGAAVPVRAATLLVLGDSLSAGYGIAREAAWPLLLQQRLRERGYEWQVFNASISGDTSAGGRSRLPKLLAEHRPGIVILELGANDALRGLPLPALHDNLTTMTRAARAAGAKVLIVGMRLPPNYGQAYTEKFHAVFAAVAKTERTALLPFMLEGFGTRRELFIDDGIHPKAEAQPLIVDNLWPVLQPLLGKAAQR